ncbi:hypothetical protein PQX77_015204 [Marasmius sp. AFHP31]|nr:hypothetical protein PQX77_015204 [Marasmius sp. AFHP31]
MTSLGNILTFSEDRRLVGIQNWPQFKDHVISIVRGKGLLGYLEGSIPQPTPKLLPSTQATNANPTTPSAEEWSLNEGYVACMVYQNIEDPDTFGLTPDMAASCKGKQLS